MTIVGCECRFFKFSAYRHARKHGNLSISWAPLPELSESRGDQSRAVKRDDAQDKVIPKAWGIRVPIELQAKPVAEVAAGSCIPRS